MHGCGVYKGVWYVFVCMYTYMFMHRFHCQLLPNHFSDNACVHVLADVFTNVFVIPYNFADNVL